MDAIEVVQKIGDEVCEGCGPDRDCGIEYDKCSRIDAALFILEEYAILETRDNQCTKSE